MSDRKYAEIGDGIYVGETGPIQEVGFPPATAHNRVWVTKSGHQKAGGQFKNGERIPLKETDLDRKKNP